MDRKRYQAILKVELAAMRGAKCSTCQCVYTDPIVHQALFGHPATVEFLKAEIEFMAPDQNEAEYIAREYARHFDGASVDSVTEMT